MAKANKQKAFSDFNEYLSYYASQPDTKNDNKKSKYYRIGENVAKMACEKAVVEIHKK